jgi:hypothetical protein
MAWAPRARPELTTLARQVPWDMATVMFTLVRGRAGSSAGYWVRVGFVFMVGVLGGG